MQSQRSIIYRLPRNVLEDVAAYTVDPLGPPKELVPLLLTCREINDALSFAACPNLYARIFRFKFDFSAARRRFGRCAAYTSSLAEQLKVHSATLKAVRIGDVYAPDTLQTLWNAFFMMSENDGRNATQLIEWAGLKKYAEKFVWQRLWETTQNGWPLDTTANALALWLMWFTTDINEVMAETEVQRKAIMDRVRPFVINPVRYQPFQVSDNYFSLPIPADSVMSLPFTSVTAHGPYPAYKPAGSRVSTHTLYRQTINVSAPLISLAAKFIYISRSEATPIHAPADWPETRAAAIAQAGGQSWVRPTQADLVEFNAHKTAVPLGLGCWERTLVNGAASRMSAADWWTQEFLSVRFDHDWSRWQHCFDVRFSGPTRTPYTPGSLTGTYFGRSLMPDFAHYQEMLDTPQYVPGYPQMNIIPISFTMSEYLSVGVPLPYGGVPGTPVNHGIRHAWYPNFECRPHGTTNVRGRREQSGMRLEAVKKGTVHEYARYEPGEQELPLQCPKVHDEDAQCVVCEKRQQVLSGRRGDNTTSPDDQLGASLVADELLHRIYTETQAALPSHLNLDELIEEEMRSLTNDDPDHDSVYKTCPGWQDVVIAGETWPRHAQAWHKFKLWGRVRTWDGLCAIISTPDNPQLSTQIFRGYVVGGQHFVGTWRLLTFDLTIPPLEGPFMATRIDPEAPVATTVG